MDQKQQNAHTVEGKAERFGPGHARSEEAARRFGPGHGYVHDGARVQVGGKPVKGEKGFQCFRCKARFDSSKDLVAHQAKPCEVPRMEEVKSGAR